jgi:Helix-turn-helix of insertion element transposase
MKERTMSDDLVPKDRDVPEPITKGLAGQQLQAIALLVQGTRPGVVARKIGIDRATLWRWRQLPQFRGHLERLRYELHTARVDRIWSLVDKAYDVVEEHLDEGDSQVALRLLGLAGGRLTDPGGEGTRPAD